MNANIHTREREREREDNGIDLKAKYLWKMEKNRSYDDIGHIIIIHMWHQCRMHKFNRSGNYYEHTKIM